MSALRRRNTAEPMRAYSLEVGVPAQPKSAIEAKQSEPKKHSPLAPLAAGIAALLCRASTERVAILKSP